MAADATLMSLASPGAGDEGHGDATQPAEALRRQHHLHQLHPAAGEGRRGSLPPVERGFCNEPSLFVVVSVPPGDAGAPAPHKLWLLPVPSAPEEPGGVWGQVGAGLKTLNVESSRIRRGA